MPRRWWNEDEREVSRGLLVEAIGSVRFSYRITVALLLGTPFVESSFFYEAAFRYSGSDDDELQMICDVFKVGEQFFLFSDSQFGEKEASPGSVFGWRGASFEFGDGPSDNPVGRDFPHSGVTEIENGFSDEGGCHCEEKRADGLSDSKEK